MPSTPIKSIKSNLTSSYEFFSYVFRVPGAPGLGRISVVGSHFSKVLLIVEVLDNQLKNKSLVLQLHKKNFLKCRHCEYKF